MVGVKLKELRTQEGFTIAQLCEKIGVNQNTYAKYERNERDVSTETLSMFADFYGVTTDYLLGRTEPTEQSNPILQLTNEEMEQRLLAAYFKLPKNVRESFIKGMSDELSKRNKSSDSGAMTHSATVRELMEAANEFEAKNGA